MTNTSRKISRRDALKVLGAAAGGTVLANLPSKWSKPELATGVLPAHAQTSVMPAVVHTLTCDDLIVTVTRTGGSITSGVAIAPAAAGILMKYVIVLQDMEFNPLATADTGSVPTDALGKASVVFNARNTAGLFPSATITWSFVNPSDGTGTCSQTHQFPVNQQ